jgi:hypothetical protein
VYSQQSGPVGATQLVGPRRVGLILQHLASGPRLHGLVQQLASHPGAGLPGGGDPLIEAVEVQVDPLGGYPVAARVGNHQVSTPPDAIQMAPQD